MSNKNRLFVIFSEKDFQLIENKLNPNDILISKEKIELKDQLVYYASEHIINDLKLQHYAFFIRNYFIKNHLDIKYSNNYFSNIAIPFLKVYDLVRFISKKYDIQEIILVGGNEKILFIPYYFAEGEVQKQLFYKSNWFYNGLLKLLLKKNKITFYKQENLLKIKLYIFMRQDLLLIMKLFIIPFKLIKWKNFIKKEKNYKITHKNIIFPVRSIAQVNSLLNLYNVLKKNGYNPLFLSYELLFNKKNETYLYLIENNLQTISTFDIKTIDLFKLIYKEFYNNFIVILKNKCLINEHLFIDFEKKVYNNLLKKSIIKLKLTENNSFLISSEIQSPEMFLEKDIFNNNFCNLQTQSMSMNPLPFICYKKFFFLENLLTYNYLKKLPNSECINFIGIFKYEDVNLYKDKINYNLEKIIFFTQPHEIENQEFIITFLCKSMKDKKIYIKLHPRDFNNYNNLLNKYSNLFIEEEKNLNTLFDKYDIIISRTTTLLLDAIIRKKLVFSITISDFDLLYKHAYINNKYLINISKKEKLKDIKKEISTFNKINLENRFFNLIKDFYGNIRFIEKFKEIF
jgi:hypothetical protein